MKMDEEIDSHREIPGLPEPEVKGKKGKKKANSKKTLSLQNFLHETSQSNQSYGGGQSDHINKSSTVDENLGGSQSDGLNKPSLSDQESAILESCHTYIHDYLKQNGPCNAHDPALQQEIQNFPEEAKKVMAKVGGYKAFILLCKDLVVVDKIVGAKAQLKSAQELAFKEICNQFSSSTPTSEQKPIWGSNSTSQNSKAQPWSSNSSYSDNSNLGSGSLHYLTSTQPPQTEDRDLSTNSSKGVIGSNLKNGIFSSGSKIGSDSTFNEELQNQIWSLTLSNNQLVKQLNEKEKYHSEMESRITQLLAEKQAASNLLVQHREEIDRLKKVIQEAKGEQPDILSKTEMNQRSDNDRDLILSLQKQLEAEKLRNLNLTQKQVENQIPGLSLQSETSTGLLPSLNPPINSLNRNSSFGGFGLSSAGGLNSGGLSTGGLASVGGLGSGGLTSGGGIGSGGLTSSGGVDSDPFGLRSMSMHTGGMQLPSTADLKGGQSLYGAIGSDLTKPRGMPPMKSTSTTGTNQSNSRGASPGLPSPGHVSGFSGGFPSGLGLPMTSFTSVMPGPTTLSRAPQHLLGPYGSQSSLVSNPSITQGSLAPGGLGLRGLVGNPPGVGQPLGVDHQQLMKGPLPQSPIGGGSIGGVPIGGGPIGGGPIGGGPIGGVQPGHVGGSEPNSAPGTPAPVSRQDQLIKKLMLHMNTSEDVVKHYIQVLRERHGKLSGWATSKIAEEILKLMKQ